MRDVQYADRQASRRAAVRSLRLPNGQPRLNGIDYIEVGEDPRTLCVRFIHPLTSTLSGTLAGETGLNTNNVQIIGGERLAQIEVVSLTQFDQQLTVRVDRRGDFSTYRLKLVRSPADPSNPPIGIDPQLAEVDFSFWAEGSNVNSSHDQTTLAQVPPPPPVIDYLAKDYASFRQLMLDRLAVTLPKWQERNPADVGLLLVELMAYRGDQLSYFQDAVATEAYLGTARRRISVRRHARLLDYAMHDGCNARVWVTFQVSRPLVLPGPEEGTEENGGGSVLLTKVSMMPLSVLRSEDELLTALSSGAQVFETMHSARLHPALNNLHFYTWGNEHCVLPAGTTQATFVDTGGCIQPLLQPGQVLILAQRISPITGLESDADLICRHPIRLTAVSPTEDPLFPEAGANSDDPNAPRQRLITVHWAEADALPFSLTLSTQVQGKPVNNISIAWGNCVLADHGRTLNAENLSYLDPNSARPYRPRLQFGPLSQQGYVLNETERRWQPFDAQAPAKSALAWEIRNARPSIRLQPKEQARGQTEGSQAMRWQPQRDLLKSGPFALDFVPETEDNGAVYLRFGDDVLGRRPTQQLQAVYRIGNGRAGNVGALSIAHVYLPEDAGSNSSVEQIITAVTNPLAAVGGIDPEPIEDVKLYAPQAFRTPQRAVTTDDYEKFAQQYPGVQRALATRRWTGSWHTLYITVDRENGLPVDGEFEADLLDFLEPMRLAGHDLKIENPQFVPLDIALRVTVKPDYFSDEVEAVLARAFSHGVLSNGERGFFHPDNFTFGQPVYLSQIIAAALQVTGVQSVQATRFQRWERAAQQALESGQIVLDRLEIAKLNNDPSAMEQGRLTFEMEGGL